MNLLYFTTAYDTGIFGNRVHEEFLARLLELGHHAAVLVPDSRRRGGALFATDPGTPAVARVAVSANRGARLANLLSGRLVHYDHFATALRGYRAYLRAHPEVGMVHVESVYPLGAVAALAAERRPFIPTIRGGDLIADTTIAYGFARFRSVRLLLRLAFARAALVRAVSPGARDMALRYGCPPEKIFVVPRNIRDECFIDDIPAFRAARRRLIGERHGLAGRAIVVAAGRLLPVKGFDDLVRAMPTLQKRVPNAVALICGPNRVDPLLGDYAAYLRRLIDEHDLREQVILVGHVPPEQMVDYLAAADAIAVPSLIEGGNKILVEGAAVGTPFVATETSGTVGFFSAEQGASVPVRDPGIFGTALADLLVDPQEWQSRSAACLVGRERFHSASVAQAMLQAYQLAISRAAAP